MGSQRCLLLLVSTSVCEMVDYGGENRYYGEAIRHDLFKRPYGLNRFGQIYDPNVIPIGSMDLTATSVDSFTDLKEFVGYKCDKYIEVSKAQYGNFDVSGRAPNVTVDENEHRKRAPGGSGPGGETSGGNGGPPTTQSTTTYRTSEINSNIDWSVLDALRQKASDGIISNNCSVGNKFIQITTTHSYQTMNLMI